jgi:hypothetical protein
MTSDLFSPPDPGDGVERVIQQTGNWHRRACSLVSATLRKGWTGTGEDIRLHLLRAGLEEPHSPNAWGSMVGQCVREGTLKATGEMRPMKVRKSHGRSTRVYERN